MFVDVNPEEQLREVGKGLENQEKLRELGKGLSQENTGIGVTFWLSTTA